MKMQNSKILKSILCISGLLTVSIGVMILFTPVTFYASNAIDITGNVNLLNETRALGAALLAFGLLISLGALMAQLAFTSMIVSSLVYLAYGFSRAISMLVDGMPVDSLVYAAVVEIVIGLISLLAFLKYRLQESNKGI